METYRIITWLQDVVDFIGRIEHYTADLDYEDYRDNRQVADAVERNIERISEATRHIPESLKAQHAEIPWRNVADIGNVLRHAYTHILDEEVWRIVREDLAPLKAAAEAMLEKLERK